MPRCQECGNDGVIVRFGIEQCDLCGNPLQPAQKFKAPGPITGVWIDEMTQPAFQPMKRCRKAELD